MSVPILPPSKLAPPALPPAMVERVAIAQRVVAAGPVRLVLLCAPPGFGKTTAMHQLRLGYAAQGADTAWLTLDAADNDTSRLLAGVSATVAPWASDSTSASADPLEALAVHTGRFVLFLDDFEALHAGPAVALIRSLVERLPRGGLMVVGSRVVPELGLGRLRAHGQLLELDATLLRFTEPESSAYLRLKGHETLSTTAIAQLHAKSEGWIVALWLASLSLDRPGTNVDEFISRFSGSNRAIAEYLADDVLAQQTSEVQQFLLRSSILRSFDASICAALMPRLDVNAILQRLQAENLFVVPESGEASYRYHRLVGDFLRTRLQREHPDEVLRLHLSASGWYEAQGRPVPAIDHAIEGCDFPYALALLQRHAQHFLEDGRMRLLARWFESIPADEVERFPTLQAVAVWATIFTRGPGDAIAQMERGRFRNSELVEVASHVNAQLPLLLAMQERYDEAGELGVEGLQRLPTGNDFADSVLRNAMAHVFSVLGDQRRARDLIDDARRSNSRFTRMYAETVEGMLDLQAGRLREATSRFRAAISATGSASRNYTSGNAWAGVVYALVLYEANDVVHAEQLNDVYLPLACDVGLAGHMISGHMIRARIAFLRGDIARSFEALTALEYLGHHRQLPRLLGNARIERARLLLLQRDAQGSKEELDRADIPELWERIGRQRLPANEMDFLALARLRWGVHFGDAHATLQAIDRELEDAVAAGRQRRIMKLRTLRALAQQRSGDPAAAVETIASVMRQASSEGFVRLIADEGPALGRLVQHFYSVLQEMPARRSDPLLMDYLRRLLDAFNSLPPEEGDTSASEALMEPLTRKELQVLQLTSEGYSNSAMTEKLGLSDSTVRTHLRNISTKLSAKSRADAVAIARRLGVIR